MEKDGQTAGILYGFVDLADFADSITVTAFDGNAQIYVADGVTGDFLVDTWHNKLGNIFDDDILSRKVKPGYDFHEMKTDFVEGNAVHIAFWSNTAGEYFYSHYMPVGVDLWMVQMTVPESVVLAKAIQIRRVLYCVAAAEILSFAVYFLWVLSRIRRDTNQKNQRLAQSLYMYDVQQTLFDAHKAPALFTTALQKEELRQRVDRLKDASGYHVSIGEAWLRESLDIKEMITIAEKNMYETKRLYYQQTGKLPRARLTVPT